MSKIWFTLCFCLFVTGPLPHLAKASPLQPVKTDTPRDTMRTYLNAMKDYQQGLQTGNDQLAARIDDAIRCFNLSEVPYLVRQETGREAAILLKEVIDRVIVIDLSKVPDQADLQRWRLKDTEVVISKTQEGDRAGEFLFSPETTARVKEFYQKVKDLPYLKGSSGGAGYQSPWQERYIPAWAQGDFLGLQKWQWLGLFMAILLGFIVKILTEFVVLLVKKITSGREDSLKHQIIVALEKPIGLTAASAFWFLSIHYLKFEGIALTILTGLIQIILGASLIWAAYRLTDVATGYLGAIASRTETDLDDQLVPLLAKSLRIFVVLFGVLVLVQNLGFNVMSLLAGLGLGGLAFALAAKDMAANLFGSIMILLDQPFRVGDWIVTANAEGTVEEIGFRSTRLRTFYNSQISVPNSVLATGNIDNMGRREFRRVRSVLGLTYDTPPEKIEAFLEGIKNIIKANPHTRKDYFHVVFDSYGDFSLNVLVYFFLNVPDWSTELVERQNVYLEILRLAKDIGVEFAFPTQTLHMETFPEKKPVREVKPFYIEDLQESAAEYGPRGSKSKPEGLGIFQAPYKEN